VVKGTIFALNDANYGQNFGRYYSSFFNPGTDEALGFDCNKLSDGRNASNCVPLRKTIDRDTGSNPFSGKYGENEVEENAFCGYISYETYINQIYAPQCSPVPPGQDALYLISEDSFKKTIIAKEKTSDSTYAISILRLEGKDTDQDGVPNVFVCAKDFNCIGDKLEPYGDLPVLDASEADTPIIGDLNNVSGDTDPDSKTDGFSNDFVPISPLRVNISYLKFYISPSDDPHYAFAEQESANQQPRVTIVLTVSPIGDNTNSTPPVTLVETVSTRMLTPIKAPILVYPQP
jgi:hypothetical protein